MFFSMLRFENEDPASQLRLVFEIRLQAILATVCLTRKSPTCNSFRRLEFEDATSRVSS